MKFQKLTITDIDKVQPYFNLLQSRTCDFTIGGMFMWRNFLDMEYDIQDGIFFSRLRDEHNKVSYHLPIGPDIKQAVHILLDYISSTGQPARFCTIPEEYMKIFKDTGIPFTVEENRNYFDYLYDAASIASLQGRKFSGQRNQINHFLRTCTSWSFDSITEENIDSIIDFFDKTYHIDENATDVEVEENRMVSEVLHNMKSYKMTGGVLRADDSVVGFSLGEIVGHTLYVHIEKADRNYPGAYQMLVQQFAQKYAQPNIVYINREEDMGDEGLRTAKLAYHPICLLKKYSLEVI